MQATLIIAFEDLSEPDFLAKTELINSSMPTNANFPGPWPSPLSSPTSITALFTAYQTAYNAALTHDAAKIVIRNIARQSLMTYLKKLAPYLEVVANGDLVKLMSTGYDLRQSPTPTGGTDPLLAPIDFRVKRADLSGVLIGHARKLKGASGYEVQICEGNPTVEGDWRHYASVKSASSFEIVGQAPGRLVSVRMRAIGSTGPGVGTTAISLIDG